MTEAGDGQVEREVTDQHEPTVEARRAEETT